MLATAVGAFPLGLDANDLPWGMQFAAPPGSDGLVLSLMLAMEKLTGPMPPPPTVAACSGCTANVTISNVSSPLPQQIWGHLLLAECQILGVGFMSSVIALRQ